MRAKFKFARLSLAGRLGVALVLATGSLVAATVQLQPMADTCLFEVNPTGNMGGYTDMAAGSTASQSRARALMQFNVAQAVPAGATITSVSLAVTVVKAPGGGPGSNFDLRRVLVAWGEGNKSAKTGSPATAGEASWMNRLSPSTPWSAPGAAAPADFSSTVSASTMVADFGSYTFASTGSLVADVQAWLDNPSANFGWIMLSESENAARTARRFASRENPSSAPVLTINYSVTVNTPPVITSQPQSQTVNVGGNASFSVTATGTSPLSYQWRLNGGNIAGATSTALALNTVATNQAGNYTVIVSNISGSITSTVAVLTVNVPPAITSQSQSQTVNVGSNASFSVTATGTSPLSYQWQLNAGNITGATSAILTLNTVATNQAGNYAVIVSNPSGSVTSAVAVLTVNVPPVITSQPQSQTVNVGGNASFSVTATGTSPLSYQWQLNAGNITGATSATLTLNTVATNQAGNYAVIVSNPSGSITSAVAVLTVNVPPAITSQPQSQTVSVGGNASFSITATGASPLNYQWQFNGTNVAGATNTTLNLSNVATNQAGNYTVTVSNLVGSATSLAASLTVRISPVIVTPPQSQTITSGINVTFNTSVAGLSPFNYQWQYNGNNLIGATNATLNLRNVAANQAGAYAVAVSNTAGTAASASAVLTVQYADTDGDGLPDWWEAAYFGSATAALPSRDSDGDGLSNLQEYLAGSDPLDPSSYLRITDVSQSGNDVLVSFMAVAGRTYAIESKDSLANATWQSRFILTNGVDGLVQMLDIGAAAVANRYYHIVTGPNGEVVSEPAGFFSLPLNPGANALSVPLYRTATTRALVSTVNGNSVTVNGNPAWTPNTFAPANNLSQYMLIVLNDTAAVAGSLGVQGDWWVITGNTTNGVTLNPGPDNLANELAPGTAVEIRKLVSIKDLFGSTILNKDNNFAAAAGDSSRADVIRFVTGTSFNVPIYYHDGTLAPAGYYLGNQGPLDGSTITILPNQGFMVFRAINSAATSFKTTGGVNVRRVTLYLQAGPNVVGIPFAGAAPIATSNLKESGFNQDSNFSAVTGTSTTSDLLRLITGTSFGVPVFYHNGTLLPAGWYQGGTLNNNFLLQPGQAYLFLNNGSNLERWRQTAP